jgi:hypothetical protein
MCPVVVAIKKKKKEENRKQINMRNHAFMVKTIGSELIVFLFEYVGCKEKRKKV